jgi:hypothetical protein
MKTAVSIPADVFRRAERHRRTAGMTRSGLYAAALAEYVKRHDPEARITSLNELIRKHGPPTPEGWSRTAAENAFRYSEW